MSEPTLPLPRSSLAVTCLGHAAVFGWAAASLPWRTGTTFAASLGLLCVLHVATGVLALLKKPAWLVWSFRLLSIASLATFVLMGWSIAAAAIYVGKLYLRLGPSVASGLVAALVILALLTLPVAIWGARHTWSKKFTSLRGISALLSVLVALLVFTLPLASSAARPKLVAHVDARLSAEVTTALERHLERDPGGQRYTVAEAGAAACKYPVTPELITLLLAYGTRNGARFECIQAETPEALHKKLKTSLRRKVPPGAVVVADLVRGVKPLSATFPLLDALEVRPGLDGVCEGTQCLPAWSLTLSDAFAENKPMPSIPDVSYGFSAEAVRKRLGSPKENAGRGIDGMLRIETETLSADAGGVHRIVRTRGAPPALSQYGVEQAVTAAQRYIVEAQEKDGTFRYSLDPESGKEDKSTFNSPRQAGTTYALCELGRGGRLRQTVKRALGAFHPAETQFGDFSALKDSSGFFGLGKSALPLLAMLRCREQVGKENDRLIGQLVRLVVRLQREDGSFFPELDEKTKQGKGEHEALYAAGQAVLSLVLLEQQLEQLKGTDAEPLPAADALKLRIDRGMAYYGGPYWPRPLRDFFFFEEGWHCLAARQALSSHRNEAYEQLCIDYVASRLRYVARTDDTGEPNFIGGYGLSDLFPPRNTATAGLGEALNASIAIKQKRGLPVAEDKAILADLVTFLLRAQWTDAGCFACKDPKLVVGGFSQMLAAPDIRIDYVQHAMAAIGHGGRLLYP